MTLKACRISSATTHEVSQSLPIKQSSEISDDSPHDKIKSFIQIDQAAVFHLLQDLDATEFKAFLFLTLRAYGWDEKVRRPGDGIARASGTYIAKGTNLSVATVERCIGKLKEKGLISKSTHSCKWGNTYQIEPTLLKKTSNEKTTPPAPENREKPSQNEGPKIEGTQKEEPKTSEVPHFEGPSPLKKNVLGPSNCGINIDSRDSHLSLSEIEDYFSKIRSPMTEKKERFCLSQIQKRNHDATDEELLECFKIVSETKDSKGQPISMKMLWLANGFDSILSSARQRIQSRKRREEEKARLSAKKESVEQEVSPEEAERAKEQIRTILGRGLFQSQQKPKSSETDRRSYLLAQAKQIEQIGKFGSLQN